MARDLLLALLSLLLFTVSCTQSSFVLRQDDTSHPQEPSQITESTTEETYNPSDGAPADATSEEENELAAAPAQEERTANGESRAGVDSGEEPYSDQKRVDDALYYYQEALEYRSSGDPDRAIQSLDHSYQVICSIQNEDDPEIKRFQTKERSFFIQSYRLSGRYRPYIVEQMRKAGIPENLSWLPLIESGFKTKALSKARALGLWQFIASTAYRYDLSRDRWVDERMNPERSTQAAIAYLKVLHGLFGDWITALAAYNCGEGNVLRVIRQQHVNYLDDFWDLYPRLPLETARYVPRFLAALHIIKDPEKYGFYDLELDQPLMSDQVQVSRQMRLKDIDRVLNLPAKTLEELNPSLRYKATPNYPFTLKLPPGTSTTFVAKLEIHRVRYGETHSAIALKYRVSVRRIVHANNLRSASRIRAGQRLKIPLRGHIVAAKSTPSLRVGSAVHYQVKRGDSLWLIAQRFKTTVTEIKTLNDMQSDLLHTGQVILVQAGRR
ncbi:MAG: LysM peptidoglycan-binding domain-containing protein [Syntrophobacterales bacterium]